MAEPIDIGTRRRQDRGVYEPIVPAFTPQSIINDPSGGVLTLDQYKNIKTPNYFNSIPGIDTGKLAVNQPIPLSRPPQPITPTFMQQGWSPSVEDQGLMDLQRTTGKSLDELRAIAQQGISKFQPTIDKIVGTRYISPEERARQTYISQQDAILNRMLYGTSPAQEAIVASLDPARMGLQGQFAERGATGAGALQSLQLKQASDIGGQLAQQRQAEQDQAFNYLMKMRDAGRADEASALAEKYFGLSKDQFEKISLPTSQLQNLITASDLSSLTGAEKGALTTQVLSSLGIDTTKIPKYSAREDYETYVADHYGWKKDANGVWRDASNNDMTTQMKNTVDVWANAAVGLDASGQPLSAVGAANDKATWEADPLGDKTISAANSGNKVALGVVVDEITSSPDGFKTLKDIPVTSDVYKAVISDLTPSNFSTAKTTNRWDDLNYFNNYAQEDQDGNVTYPVGTRFTDNNVPYEITGQGYDYEDDGQIYMVTKNLITGEVKKFYPGN